MYLKHRKLTEIPGRRSLKGVSPALPFSDMAFRRYYDHCMTYTDFKEASKSDDKHRLYLGLLSGPLYPETVIYVFRDRLLDQIERLCDELGRERLFDDLGRPRPYKELQIDALLPPIKGSSFDVDEVRFLLSLYFAS